MLNGSLISSASMIKERERGTVEQLLMTPASTTRNHHRENPAVVLAAVHAGLLRERSCSG